MFAIQEFDHKNTEVIIDIIVDEHKFLPIIKERIKTIILINYRPLKSIADTKLFKPSKKVKKSYYLSPVTKDNTTFLELYQKETTDKGWFMSSLTATTNVLYTWKLIKINITKKLAILDYELKLKNDALKNTKLDDKSNEKSDDKSNGKSNGKSDDKSNEKSNKSDEQPVIVQPFDLTKIQHNNFVLIAGVGRSGKTTTIDRIIQAKYPGTTGENLCIKCYGTDLEFYSTKYPKAKLAIDKISNENINEFLYGYAGTKCLVIDEFDSEQEVDDAYKQCDIYNKFKLSVDGKDNQCMLIVATKDIGTVDNNNGIHNADFVFLHDPCEADMWSVWLRYTSVILPGWSAPKYSSIVEVCIRDFGALVIYPKTEDITKGFYHLNDKLIGTTLEL